jgi:SH3-like domain-containing protein
MKRMAALQRTQLILFFIIPLLVVFYSTATSAAQYVSVKKDGVNIRSGPATKEEVLWEVFQDFPLKVLEEKGKWTQTVDFEGDKGWVYSQLLSDKKTVIVRVKTANMRIGPGTNYEIVATVKYGVVFKLGKVEDDWVEVSHEDGTNGWLYKDLLWPSDF